MRRIRGVKIFLTGVASLLMFLGICSASASSANISRSYHASQSIPNGSILSLDLKQTDSVRLANTDNGAGLLGVAIAVNDSLIAEDPSSGTVQVATSGTATTLVSTLNGNISVGDQIAVSPFNGIGAKALPGSHVIGQSQTTFKSSDPSATSQQITDKAGKISQVKLGYVRLSINIAIANTGVGASQDLSSLQRFIKSLTGHTVSNARIIISLVITAVGMITLISLIYGSIYGSITSIGRNPLAKHVIFRSLSAVSGMILVTAAATVITVFFLLR